jgi:hypothetical protein
MPIVSEAIAAIVAKFSDSKEDACDTAMNAFIELVKHGNLNNFFIAIKKLICL